MVNLKAAKEWVGRIHVLYKSNLISLTVALAMEDQVRKQYTKMNRTDFGEWSSKISEEVDDSKSYALVEVFWRDDA